MERLLIAPLVGLVEFALLADYQLQMYNVAQDIGVHLGLLRLQPHALTHLARTCLVFVPQGTIVRSALRSRCSASQAPISQMREKLYALPALQGTYALLVLFPIARAL